MATMIYCWKGLLTLRKSGFFMKHTPIAMTFFSQVHPVALTLYFTELIICLLLFNHVAVAMAEFVALIIMGAYYLGGRSIARQLKYGLSFLLLILFFNTLLNQKFPPILWHFKWGILTFQFSYPAFLYGIAMAIVLIAMLFVFSVLNRVLTPSKLIYVFSPIAPRLAVLVTISFTLVTNFTTKFRQILRLQRTRNVDASTGSLKIRTQKMIHIFEILLQDSLSSAMETANLMDARGFGATKRTHYRSYHWQLSDVTFISLATAILLTGISLRVVSMGASRSVASFTTIFMVNDGWPILITVLLFLLPLISEGVYRLWAN